MLQYYLNLIFVFTWLLLNNRYKPNAVNLFHSCSLFDPSANHKVGTTYHSYSHEIVKQLVYKIGMWLRDSPPDPPRQLNCQECTSSRNAKAVLTLAYIMWNATCGKIMQVGYPWYDQYYVINAPSGDDCGEFPTSPHHDSCCNPELGQPDFDVKKI